ncbi:3-dehydroquinate synthase family protein, partial [Bacteroidota bacterium]
GGENNKSLETVNIIWNYLGKSGIDRKSIIINLGGGMLCDLGAFAASTIKRGIDFINIPTTLLAMVDAAIGGKAGFNFNGLKNEIGLIKQPNDVIIDVRFLKTLDSENILSGYGEMLKYALTYDKELWKKLLSFNLQNINYESLSELILNSVNIKKFFVESDPFEKNIRKALNFGHTFGHAFESFSINSSSPVIHGKAIAYGMICETFLSYKRAGLDEKSLNDITRFIIDTFGNFYISSDKYEVYINLMKYDKKNENDKINCTLIPEIGKFTIDNFFKEDEIAEALDFMRNF